jgi:zinc protease
MTLGNGLRVVLVEDPHASEVQVTMRYRVGAGDDLEFPGMAHLVEHLMFQQTLGSQTLKAHLEESATYANAFTTHDATTYISRARPDLLDKLLSIEAVRLGFRCTSITDSAFEREREVVTQEIKLRDDVTEIFDAVNRAVFPDGHPYRQAIGGTVESVSAITRAQACAFADAHYSPGNAVLVVSGNVTPDRIQSALGKFLARIAKRVGAAPNVVAAARAMPRREVPAPIDEKVLLVTWPLPMAPDAQLLTRVIAYSAAAAVNQSVKGKVFPLTLGDVRAPVVGFAILPRGGETLEDVTKTVDNTLARLPVDLGDRRVPQQAYEALRQRMIYSQYASLEDGSGRDSTLAEHVLAGRDPAAALAAEFQALRQFDRTEAANVAKQYLSFESANVVTLVPREGGKRGRSFALRTPPHDLGQRRSIPDPARAHAPDTTVAIPSAAIQTRVLPNGLKVVLMPLSTVPTVDIRLVFGAGSGHDPVSKGGAALLAGYGLTWDLHHINDLLSFALAGGEVETQVTRDSTSFVVRGVDMHIDYLLAGLKRWAVDGRYDDTSETVADAVKRMRKEVDEDDEASNAFSAAQYGPQHPYARVTALRNLSSNLTVDDAEEFRRAYHTPDNATLVIAGRVDIAVANRWVDFLFRDWQGVAQKRDLPPSTPEPAALARHEDLTQMLVLAALPARNAPRAELLVTAAMLDEICRDVRHQLGAAYVFNASLDESRVGSSLVITGWIDPARAQEVINLLRTRIAQLRDDRDAAARAFVLARTRAITQLSSITGSASQLAARAETDISLGRAPLSDLLTAKEVQALTVDKIAPILGELDLSRAAVLVRGPADPVKATFAALGREANVIAIDRTTLRDTLDEPTSASRRDATSSREQVVMFSDIEESLTDQSLAALSPIEINVQLTIATNHATSLVPPTQTTEVDSNGVGFNLHGEVGYRFLRRASAGIGVGVGRQSATYGKKSLGIVYEEVPYQIIPVDIGAFVHIRPFDRVWAGFLLGLHYDQTRFSEEVAWHRSMGLSFELGYDVLSFGTNWLSAVVRATASYGSDVGYGAIAGGVAFRR